jgi:hypothetical protein
MSRRRPQVAIAMFLPLSFLWLTLACVATCEAQAETHSASTIWSAESATPELTTHISSCPLRSLPEAAIPQRLDCKANVNTTALNSLSIRLVHVGRAGIILTHSGASPPPESDTVQFSALRI